MQLGGHVIEVVAGEPWWALAVVTLAGGVLRRVWRRCLPGGEDGPALWSAVATGYGWRTDPVDSRRARFHDETQWTDLVTRNGTAWRDPLP